MPVRIRRARNTDAGEVSRLILGLADFFMADRASEESRTFLATVEPQAVAERIVATNFRCCVAEGPTGLCGFVALRDGLHLYHLFVAAEYHRQGIGRRLWEHVRAQSGASAFTVNASLPAVPVYERFGFVPAGAPVAQAGLEFMPMVWMPDR